MDKKHRFYLILGVLGVLLAGCATVRPPSAGQPVTRRMLVTGYCRCGDCCGWKRNWIGVPVVASGAQKGAPKLVGMSASGAMARYGTIAAGPAKYPFGTIMYVDGYGYGRVEDTGSMVKGEHIDIFFRSHAQARKWGARRDMSVTIWQR